MLRHGLGSDIDDDDNDNDDDNDENDHDDDGDETTCSQSTQRRGFPRAPRTNCHCQDTASLPCLITFVITMMLMTVIDDDTYCRIQLPYDRHA